MPAFAGVPGRSAETERQNPLSMRRCPALSGKSQIKYSLVRLRNSALHACFAPTRNPVPTLSLTLLRATPQVPFCLATYHRLVRRRCPVTIGDAAHPAPCSHLRRQPRLSDASHPSACSASSFLKTSMCVDLTLILIFSGLLLGLHCADCSDSRRHRCVRGELRTMRAVSFGTGASFFGRSRVLCVSHRCRVGVPMTAFEGCGPLIHFFEVM